jgi:hypothetical protein
VRCLCQSNHSEAHLQSSEACIKGHRSSSCKHTDRPLFEIKKKGRPVTQCEHCRELRKTKQVHVKCICQGKTPTPEEKGKKGESTACIVHSVLNRLSQKGCPSYSQVILRRFWPRLPTQTACPLLSRASHHIPLPSPRLIRTSLVRASPCYRRTPTHLPIGQSHTCGCKDDKDCHCFTLKYHPHRKAASSDPGPSSLALTPLSSTRRGSTNLRPVLPKPPQTSSSAINDNASVLAPRPHLPPRSTHGSTFFSPYGRAYNEHFITEPPLSGNQAHEFASLSDQPPSLDLPTLPVNVGPPTPIPPTSPIPDPMQWSSHNLAASSCSCGDGCVCPGCVEHRGASGWFTRECANPGVCTTCFTCLTGERLAPPPAPTPPTTPLGARSSRELEQWMDGVAGITSSFFTGFDMHGAQQQHPSPINIDILSLSPSCVGLCVPGQCTCASDSNSECQRNASPFFANLSSSMLPPTFDLDFDMNASMYSLPDTSSRGRSSSYPYYTEGDLENLRYATPKASSTTSLLPIFDADNTSSSLMARVFPSRGPADFDGVNQPSPPRAQSQQRRSGNSQHHLSGAFFEAAARRFG